MDAIDNPGDQTSLALDTQLSAEDLARADLYGLLALLFYSGPPQELLEKIANFNTAIEKPEVVSSSLLQGPWDELVRVAKNASSEDWQTEYETYFVGVGKQEIFLYGSYYLTGFLNEKPLAYLREELKVLGLEGSDDISETEDHIACLCEIMRYLIAGEDLGVCNLTQQKKFFNEQIRPWAGQLFDTLEAHSGLTYYRHVGLLSRTFFEIEGQAFDML
jgi:TorA maturation chaperone TorD